MALIWQYGSALTLGSNHPTLVWWGLSSSERWRVVQSSGANPLFRPEHTGLPELKGRRSWRAVATADHPEGDGGGLQ